VGTNGTATLIGVTGIYLLFFMTTMLGIEPALAGALILASKIYDLVTDPLMGYLSDRTRLMSFRTLFSSLGLLIGTAVAPIIVSTAGGTTVDATILRPPGEVDCVLPPGRAGQVAGTPEGYALMGAVIAVIVFVSMALCLFGAAYSACSRWVRCCRWRLGSGTRAVSARSRPICSA
jgi:Na+/melibiose symporter-like transporter